MAAEHASASCNRRSGSTLLLAFAGAPTAYVRGIPLDR
jgi:hypothetical protein